MFETIFKPTNPLYHSSDYEHSLQCLEKSIGGLELPVSGDYSDGMPSSKTPWVVTLELYRIASLIYLKRASRNFSARSPQIDAMAERAFAILGDLDTFNPSFPLMIVGCEAWSDKQEHLSPRY